MLSISLGPVALPVGPLVLLLAAAVAAWVATWVAGRVGARRLAADRAADGPALAQAAGQHLYAATGWGLLAARLVHVAAHAGAYAASPLSALDLRDGGWHVGTGLAAGLAWLTWQGWRAPASRGALALGALAGLGLWTAGTLATRPDDAAMPGVSLAALEGDRMASLPLAAGGRPVVVNLWASWCGPCRQEMPTLAAAQQRDDQVGVLFVNQGESAPVVQAYLAGAGLHLREVWLDPGARLGPAVGSRGLPTTLFYDAHGQLVDAHFGVLNPAALAARMQALRRPR